MQAYTSRCSGKTLDHLKAAGWRFIVEPSQGYRSPCPIAYGLDNGAWGCHVREEPFNVEGFERVLADHGADADWIVLPDIVGGGLDSLRLSAEWERRVKSLGRPMLLPVQDGMEPADIRAFTDRGVGIFLGGSTEWKLETMREWGAFARHVGAYYHVARVNSAKRIRLCKDAGADSFDGSSPVKFRVTLPKLDNERRQGHLFGGMR